MTFLSLRNWLKPLARRSAICRHRQHRDRFLRARFVPRLEALEDRIVPSTLTVASTADSGEGSLRAALNAAQNGDTIVFASDLAGTIQLQSALPNLNASISILGPGADQLTVEGNYPWYNPYPDYQTFFNIFTVGSAGDVEISGLTLTHSSLAAIRNDGSIDVNNCTFADNFSDGTAAIDNKGSATINNSILVDNSIADATILNTGTLIVSNSTLSDNFTGSAIVNTGNLTLSNSTLSGNTGRYGAAISNHGSATINNSTLSGNEAIGPGATSYTTNDGPYGPQSYYFPAGNGLGGGIYLDAGVLTINSSTLANNQAAGGSDPYAGLPGEGYGGSLYIAGGTISINNSTLAGNQAVGGVGIDSSGIGYGGAIYNAAGSSALQIHNSILAGNLADTGSDLDGSLISLGHNLIGNSTGGNGFAASDLLNVNPQLGPLQNNGGPTQTMALLSGSPALDAGDNSGTPAYDQRGLGFPRIVNDILDIGAFEVQSDSSTQASSLDVVGFPSVISAGVAGTVTVTARTSDGTADTSYTGTVQFSNSDPNATILDAVTGNRVALAGFNYQFTAADNGSHTFLVDLKTVGPQSITATDSTLTGTQTGIRVVPLASVSGPSAGTLNQTLTYILEASGDPPDTLFSFNINWGDGSTETISGPSGSTVSHEYTTSGSRSIAVAATDPDGFTSNPVYQFVNILPVSVTVEADPADRTNTKQMLVLDGTAGSDNIVLVGDSSKVSLNFNNTPLGDLVPSLGYSFDLVVVFGEGGNDTLNAKQLAVGSVLVGGSGKDTLYGGSAPSLLIGGSGSDLLYAGSAGAILIGGTTNYDSLTDHNLTALASIMAEWSSNADYLTRTKSLQSYLNSTTVFDDNASDGLYGGAGLDWYLAHLKGKNKDRVQGETSGEATYQHLTMLPRGSKASGKGGRLARCPDSAYVAE